MQRAGTAEGDQRELARVVPAVDRLQPDRVSHVRDCDPDDALGHRLDRHSERPGETREASTGFAGRQFDARRERICSETAEDEICVGERGLRATSAVARRPGRRAGALRPDAQGATRVDVSRRCPTRANAANVRRRDAHRVIVDLRAVGDRDLIVEHECRIAARSADVTRDHTRPLQPARQERRRDGTADGTAAEREHGEVAERVRAAHPSVGLHEQEPAAKAVVTQPLVHALQVSAEHGQERRIHGRRDHALVLADHRGDLGRDRDEPAGYEIRQPRFRLPFVGVVDG